MSESDSVPESTSLATFVVGRLLDRHGVSARQRVTLVEEVLGLSYQQARRRVQDTTAWTLEELLKLAEHFGENLPEAIGTVSYDPAVPALLVSGALRLPCSLWYSGPPMPGRQGPLVARQVAGGEWLVSPPADAGGVPTCLVRRLLITTEQGPARRVAVLDDDQDLAKSIADYMNTVGLAAQPFYSVSELRAAVQAKPFDGYVLDWILGKETTRGLIAEIRADDSACPIVVLTGQLAQGGVGEADLAALALNFRLQYFEKPTRTSSIMSALELGFPRP